MQQAADKRAMEVWGIVEAQLLVCEELVVDDAVLGRLVGAVLLLVKEEMRRGTAKRWSKRRQQESAERTPAQGYELVLERDSGGQHGGVGAAGDVGASVRLGGGREEGSDGDAGPRGDGNLEP